MEKFLKIITELLKSLTQVLQRPQMKPVPRPISVETNTTPIANPQSSPQIPPEPKNEKAPDTSTGFLVCPVQLKDAGGQPVTSRTAKITAVIDHLGTAIDPDSVKPWGINAKDQKVKAFNEEVGDGENSADKPYGYAKKIPAPFFSAKEINYVGAAGVGDKYGPTFYLNYDGHAGYDFKCADGTGIIAPADGDLYKAQTDPIDGVNKSWYLKNFGKDNPTAWEGWHTFYIKHINGYSTWFLHCTKLVDEIENVLNDYQKFVSVKQGHPIAFSGHYGGVPPHLHFEVRDDKGVVVDPYKDQLWKDY